MSNCYKHPNKPAVGSCTSCGRDYCSDCLHVKNGKLYCTSCARNISPSKGTIYYLVGILLIIAGVGVILNIVPNAEHLHPIIVGLLVVLCLSTIVFGYCLYKKSFEYLPPKISSAEGYSALLESAIVHNVTYNGADPLPQSDSNGNAFYDETSILLSGYSRTNFGGNAQDGIKLTETHEQVFLKHDATNAHDEFAIYAENKYGQYLGWIPDTARYKGFKQELCELLKDTAQGSILAYVTNIDTSNEDFAKLLINIARYGDPRFFENKMSNKPTRDSHTIKDPAAEIAKYKALLDSGAITQEEYDAKKKQLLEI